MRLIFCFRVFCACCGDRLSIISLRLRAPYANKYIILINLPIIKPPNSPMDNLNKLNQSFTIRSSKNTLPVLSQRSLIVQNVESLRKQDFDNRMHELEGSIRLLEKKYKQNLKEGFQNKIKSFRLQAVMERKVIKATIQETKKQIQQEQLKEKMKRAQSQRERQAMRNQSINERRKLHNKRIRVKAEMEKDLIREKIREQEERLYYQNKQMHDRIAADLKGTDRKKIYFDSLKKFQTSKQIEKEKKQCLSRIIQNKEILTNLKNELAALTKEANVNAKQHTHLAGLSPFLTI